MVELVAKIHSGLAYLLQPILVIASLIGFWLRRRFLKAFVFFLILNLLILLAVGQTNFGSVQSLVMYSLLSGVCILQWKSVGRFDLPRSSMRYVLGVTSLLLPVIVFIFIERLMYHKDPLWGQEFLMLGLGAFFCLMGSMVQVRVEKIMGYLLSAGVLVFGVFLLANKSKFYGFEGAWRMEMLAFGLLPVYLVGQYFLSKKQIKYGHGLCLFDLKNISRVEFGYLTSLFLAVSSLIVWLVSFHIALCLPVFLVFCYLITKLFYFRLNGDQSGEVELATHA